MNKPQINHLPKRPGVYLFKNSNRQVLYVGKALDLRNRVKSYFHTTENKLEVKTPLLVPQIASVEYIEVRSDIEALLLEANLIKKFQPKYNAKLKDDKSYLYIKITTGEDFPKVSTTRQENLPNTTYFGPFPSAKTVRNTLKSLRRIFPYCNCRFRTCQKRQSCFYHEIGLDAGPCLGLVSKEEYRRMVHRFILLLEGKKEKLIRELKSNMEEAARREEFEKAQSFKKQITGIEYLTRPVTSPQIYLEEPEYLAKMRQSGLGEIQKFLALERIPSRIECFDVSNIHGHDATGSMVVFYNGQPEKSQYRRFKIHDEGKPNDVTMIKEVIRRRLGHSEWPQAGLLVVDGGKGQVSGAREALSEHKAEIPVIGLAKRLEEIIIPQKGREQQETEFTILRLPKDSTALHLLQAIRDEAHRFALSYHRKLRLKIIP